MESLNDISLRAATENDIPTIVALIHAAFKEYDGALDPPSGAHKESAENIRHKLTTERAVLALLNPDGERGGEDARAPLWCDVQRWRYALPDTSADFATLNASGSGLFFAGDYMSGPGRLHLAIESGWRVASLIERMLDEKG